MAQENNPSSPKKNRGCLSVLGWLVVIFAVIHFFNNRSPSAGEPATEPTVNPYLTAVPENLQDHPFLQSKGKGNCKTLTGDTLLTVIFVNDPDASWTEEERSRTMADIGEVIQTIADDAAARGAALTIIPEYRTATVPFSFVRDEYTAWADSAMTSAGLTDPGSAQQELAAQHGVSSAPILLMSRQNNRSFAHCTSHSAEYAIVFRDTTSLYHELCHLYGAKDFYYPEEVRARAELYFPESIMNGSSGVVDDLTAYLIGWKTALSEDSLIFLNATSYLTEEKLQQAHKLEVYTGYVTDFSIGDTVYTGYLEYGWLHGEGKMIRDGATWEGTWDHGSLNGHGTFISAAGNTYVGDWVDNVMHGSGTYTWENGNVYVGEFTDGKRHGTGTFTWENGNVYTGSFENNEMHGNGKITFPNGTVLTGTWVEGTISWGKMTYSNGDTYEGEISQGKRHGTGTYTYANGRVLSGQWENGEFID